MPEQPLSDDELKAVRTLVPIAPQIVQQTSTGGIVSKIEDAISNNPKASAFIATLGGMVLLWVAGRLGVPVGPPAAPPPEPTPIVKPADQLGKTPEQKKAITTKEPPLLEKTP